LQEGGINTDNLKAKLLFDRTKKKLSKEQKKKTSLEAWAITPEPNFYQDARPRAW
jgi:hypothetical protein